MDIPIYFFNTKGKTKQEFKSLRPKEVRYYSCGPTVYHYAHVGNLFSFNLSDWLRRLFSFLGYKVVQVMNITDVGHLTHDADMGEEDRIMKALNRWKQEGKQNVTVQDVIDYYTAFFVRDLVLQNIKIPTFLPFASHHIKEMQDVIKQLEKKGFAYKTPTAVYYHVPKFKHYNKLYKQALEEKVVKAREEVKVDTTKKHPADFRLWQLDQKDHIMQWDSPWGRGFPGWHIECSAMSMKYLGHTLDIHTGGVDHIPLHHTNEIAQSEASTGKEYANYWLHNQHVKIEGEKMAKSAGNFYTLTDVLQKGYKPWHVRFFYSLHHYRTVVDFKIAGLEKAKQTYQKLSEYFQIAKTRLIVMLKNNRQEDYAIEILTNLFVELSSWANIVQNINNTNLQDYLELIKGRETGYVDIFAKNFDGYASQTFDSTYAINNIQYVNNRQNINASNTDDLQVQSLQDKQVLTLDQVFLLLTKWYKAKLISKTDAETIKDYVKQLAQTYANDLSGPNLWSITFRLLKQAYNKHPIYTLTILAVATYLTGVALIPFILPADNLLDLNAYKLDKNLLYALALGKNRLVQYSNIMELLEQVSRARQNKDYLLADKLKKQVLEFDFVKKIVDLQNISVVIVG